MVSIELNEMTEISMLNQINNSDWRSIDAMFTTPHMLDFIEHSLNECDPYDINPEIVFIDEFDSVIMY